MQSHWRSARCASGQRQDHGGRRISAAGGVEAIATIKAILTGKLHPTINFKDPEEELEGFNIVGDKAENFKVKTGISNSFGFGGHNSVVVFGPAPAA